MIIRKPSFQTFLMTMVIGSIMGWMTVILLLSLTPNSRLHEMFVFDHCMRQNKSLSHPAALTKCKVEAEGPKQ